MGLGDLLKRQKVNPRENVLLTCLFGLTKFFLNNKENREKIKIRKTRIYFFFLSVRFFCQQ